RRLSKRSFNPRTRGRRRVIVPLLRLSRRGLPKPLRWPGTASRRSAARSARGRGAHPLLLPAPAARGVARPAARTLPAFPTPPLTPRLARWSSLSQAVSPSVRALVAPEVLTANRRLHRRLSFTRPLTLPRLTRTCCRCVRLQGAVENDLRSGFISFPGWLAVGPRKNVPENVAATARTRPKTTQRQPGRKATIPR